MADEAGPPTYDESAVRRIIETAMEIQVRQGDRISRTELEAIAGELGISRETVAQAVEELRRAPPNRAKERALPWKPILIALGVGFLLSAVTMMMFIFLLAARGG